MPENTGGIVGAEKTTAASEAPEKTSAPGDGAEQNTPEVTESRGAQQRIQQLAAELKRKNELLESLRSKVSELEERTKTEEEKRIEELAKERFGPQLQRLEMLQRSLEEEYAQVREQIPDEHKGLILDDDSIPIERRLAHARNILAFLSQKKTVPPVSGGAPTAQQGKPTYTMAEYQKWVESSSTDLKYYQEHREEMLAAIREGRVEGLASRA